jgi:hypothetical protein
VWGGGRLGTLFRAVETGPHPSHSSDSTEIDTVGFLLQCLKVTQYMDRYCWVFIPVTVSHITLKNRDRYNGIFITVTGGQSTWIGTVGFYYSDF